MYKSIHIQFSEKSCIKQIILQKIVFNKIYFASKKTKRRVSQKLEIDIYEMVRKN